MADVVGALVRIAAEPAAIGQVINIGSTHEITIAQLAERIRTLTGSTSPITLVPYDEAYESGFEDMPRRVPDLTKARALIGYAPRFSIDDVITEVLEFFRKEVFAANRRA